MAKTRVYDLVGWFDGSCAPVNPGGTAGWGFVLHDRHGVEISREHGVVGSGPKMSNNVGEHAACANLLELVADLAGRRWRVLVFGDSNLVINQMAGRWKAKNGLYIDEYRRGVRALANLRRLGVKVTFRWVPRMQNELADELSTSYR